MPIPCGKCILRSCPVHRIPRQLLRMAEPFRTLIVGVIRRQELRLLLRDRLGIRTGLRIICICKFFPAAKSDVFRQPDIYEMILPCSVLPMTRSGSRSGKRYGSAFSAGISVFFLCHISRSVRPSTIRYSHHSVFSSFDIQRAVKAHKLDHVPYRLRQIPYHHLALLVHDL